MKLKNKKILITGADGFIGSHLTEALMSEGAKVRAFCYYNAFGSWGWLDTFPKDMLKRIEIVTGDIRDPYGVRQAVKGCQAVFHLAALIGIPFSYHSPDNYIDTNVKGTLNVLQAARDLSVERVFVTSTSEVYGTARYIPIDEKHPLQAQSPYSASKIAADKVTESFIHSFDFPATIVRPFNTFGPRQSARAVIPTIISQFLNGGRTIKVGDQRPRRDFNFVTDVCQGYVEIARSARTKGEVVQIASGREISIKDVVKKIAGLMPEAKGKKTLSVKERCRPQHSEVMRLCGDNRKIRRLTEWRPQVSLEEGLKMTIAWMRQNRNRYKPEIYNV